MHKSIDAYKWFICFLLILSLVIFVVCVFSPHWESNDDISMAMLAHGFGIASESSRYILFSHVFWGELVSRIPSMFEMNGYTLAHYFLLFISASIILKTTSENTESTFYSLLIVTAVFWKPLIEPQFTINSGLLMVAAILSLLQWLKSDSFWGLALFLFLSILSYLVRAEEFVFVLLVAMPLILTTAKGKRIIYLFAALLLIVVSLKYIDNNAYDTTEWDYYKELNAQRAPFTDFGARKHVKNYPEVLASNGLTNNDVDLIKNWFFVDTTIASPGTLEDVLDQTGFHAKEKVQNASIIFTFKKLGGSYLGWLLFAGIAAFFIRPSLRLFSSWCLFGLCVAMLTVLGRGHVFRVYYPVLAMLTLYAWQHNASLSSFKNAYESRIKTLLSTAVVLLLVLHVITWTNLVKAKNEHSYSVLAQLPSFNKEYLVVWGAALPYELLYPVVSVDSKMLNLNIFGLGVSTFAPNTLANKFEKSGDGFLSRFRSKDGILLVAKENQFGFLKRYCSEHFGVELRREPISSGSVSVERVHCI